MLQQALYGKQVHKERRTCAWAQQDQGVALHRSLVYTAAKTGCQTGEEMLQIEGLRKEFLLYRGLRGFLRPERRTVLHELDLRVEPGQIVGIEGANGSGKTTLLKVIAGLLAPTSGTVQLEGGPGAAGITVADSRSFYWRLSCRANLEFFGALARLQPAPLRRRIEEVSERIGIRGQLDDPFMTLSSGQMQRLAIVRTLIAAPRLWLLDEATRSLDEAGRNAVGEELSRLRQMGGSALWISHDRSATAPLCSPVYTLDNGRLTQQAGAV